MPDRDYIIPVVAHRVFGRRAILETVEPPSYIPKPPRRPILTFGSSKLDRSRGTERSVEEVEALFAPNPDLAHTGGRTANDYWAPVGIRFELLAITDRSVSSDLADFMPRERRHFTRMADRFNVPRALNVYCVRDIQGAWGRAYPTQPDEPDASPGYAFISDRFEDDAGGSAEERWAADLITTAHELGHALGLLHRLEEDNLMFAYGTDERTTRLTDSQRSAAEYFARCYRRAVYPPDAVPHLEEPRPDQYPFA